MLKKQIAKLEEEKMKLLNTLVKISLQISRRIIKKKSNFEFTSFFGLIYDKNDNSYIITVAKGDAHKFCTVSILNINIV